MLKKKRLSFDWKPRPGRNSFCICRRSLGQLLSRSSWDGAKSFSLRWRKIEFLFWSHWFLTDLFSENESRLSSFFPGNEEGLMTFLLDFFYLKPFSISWGGVSIWPVERELNASSLHSGFHVAISADLSSAISLAKSTRKGFVNNSISESLTFPGELTAADEMASARLKAKSIFLRTFEEIFHSWTGGRTA